MTSLVAGPVYQNGVQILDDLGHFTPGVGVAAGPAPIVLPVSPLLTTPAAGSVEYDGNAAYVDLSAGNRGVIDAASIYMAQVPINLLSQTAAQPMFVDSGSAALTNGTIALPKGCYMFECQASLSALSATSGGFGFSLVASNSGVIGEQAWTANAIKGTIATPANTFASWNVAASTEIASASTATVGWFNIYGMFTVTTAGTFAPSISQSTAATAIVGVGSFFSLNSIGAATVTGVGAWT